MQTQLEISATPAIPLPLDRTVRPEPANSILRDQLASLDRTRRNVDAIVAFLKVHHRQFEGLVWNVTVIADEIHIRRLTLFPADEIASRFPGEWKTGCNPWVCVDLYTRDWVAVRDGVTLRICNAERVELTKEEVRFTTF